MELKICPFCGNKAKLVNIEKDSLVEGSECNGGALIKCSGCTAAMSGKTNAEAVEAWNKRADGIALLQYENLRKHFNELVNDVLGSNYYNEGMDVYSADEFSCRDLKAKLKRKWLI